MKNTILLLLLVAGCRGSGSSKSAPHAQKRAPPPLAPPLARRTCTAAKPVVEEATRLLAAVADHSTRSKACNGGQGLRVTIDEIDVCPVGTVGGANIVEADFRLTLQQEGDQKACKKPDDCPWLTPDVSRRRLQLRFSPAPGGTVVSLPRTFPGFELVSPLDSPHDTVCYGSKPQFVPRVLPAEAAPKQ